jgi:SagB-type dehydrogenase family enzyme
MQPGTGIVIKSATMCVLAGFLFAARPDAHNLKQLPEPRLDGNMSLEQAIKQRRSVREFSGKPLTTEQVAQLCWAGQGITDPKHGYRAAPSAGALYPLELYVLSHGGLNRYVPEKHAFEHKLDQDLRMKVEAAALHQEAIGDAPDCIIITAVVERSAKKYGDRAERYCFMEAGHVAQNILLQATAMDLAGVPVGAFDDRQLQQILKLPKNERVLYLLPVGHPEN